MTPEPARLAAEALRLYGLEGARLVRLGGIDNVNFRVDTETRTYALHLLAPRQTRAAVASELVWLDRLRSDLLLNVPEPVPNRNGEGVSSVTLDGTETLCALMRWLPGEVPPTVDAMTPGQLEEAGALMAGLHRHAQGFRVPESFRRPTYGETHFRDRFGTLHKALEDAEFNRDDLAAFAADADAVLSRFGKLGRTGATFGLIHADFHSGNYVLDGDAVSLIDFGRCGFGYYLHDLALALTELNGAQRESFLRGYEAHRPRPAGYADHLETFLVLAYLDNLGTLARDPEEVGFIVGEMPFVVAACRRAAG